jgi:integrase/recombinase XerD
MYACGLRIGEAATLEVGAIDKANQVLRVIGKGNTERHVPLPQPVLDDLRKMWKSHHNPKWLFPNRDGTRSVDRGVLLRTFAQVVQDAGLKGTATSHTLRHSYATRLMENGVDTCVVQILLGMATYCPRTAS